MKAIASAAETHDRMAAAYLAQRERFAPPNPDMWSWAAGNFKADLQAPLSGFLLKIAAYLDADDVLIDVGGGAGRLSLPLAGRCREVVCIDPSPAMGELFESTARDGGVKNARFVGGSWLEAGEIEGDVALVAHVTYFVSDIAPFVEKLDHATRRRVLIVARSTPPPNQMAPFFKLIRGEEQALAPGPDQTRAVLRELGIEANVIDTGEAPAPVMMPVAATRDDAVRIEVEGSTRIGWLRREEAEQASRVFLDHFDELFLETPNGFRRRSGLDAHELIITWETRG
jgi:2-polyprenyl-3-methyl-5-hydroxy-6-metoxy-1,4-benzoquinol methylase